MVAGSRARSTAQRCQRLPSPGGLSSEAGSMTAILSCGMSVRDESFVVVYELKRLEDSCSRIPGIIGDQGALAPLRAEKSVPRSVCNHRKN